MDLSEISGGVLYSVIANLHRYRGQDFLNHIENGSYYFMQRIYSHFGGKSPAWEPGTGYTYEGKNLECLERAKEFMREFILLGEDEMERALVEKSVAEAAKYSIKVKNKRFSPEVERLFLERCKGKKSRLTSLMSYCGKWGIIPENMTEITLVAGFEDGRRGDLGKEFIERLSEYKAKCKEMLAQIMKIEGIGEDESIATIMGKLG